MPCFFLPLFTNWWNTAYSCITEHEANLLLPVVFESVSVVLEARRSSATGLHREVLDVIRPSNMDSDHHGIGFFPSFSRHVALPAAPLLEYLLHSLAVLLTDGIREGEFLLPRIPVFPEPLNIARVSYGSSRGIQTSVFLQLRIQLAPGEGFKLGGLECNLAEDQGAGRGMLCLWEGRMRKTFQREFRYEWLDL